MREEKRNRLAAAGWRLGTAADFLGMTPAEAAYLEIRQRLAEGVKSRRVALHLSQSALAKAIGSSQSRVAKMEAGDPTVSLDLLIRTLLGLGASKRELASLITKAASRRAA